MTHVRTPVDSFVAVHGAVASMYGTELAPFALSESTAASEITIKVVPVAAAASTATAAPAIAAHCTADAETQ